MTPQKFILIGFLTLLLLTAPVAAATTAAFIPVPVTPTTQSIFNYTLYTTNLVNTSFIVANITFPRLDMVLLNSYKNNTNLNGVSFVTSNLSSTVTSVQINATNTSQLFGSGASAESLVDFQFRYYNITSANTDAVTLDPSTTQWYGNASTINAGYNSFGSLTSGQVVPTLATGFTQQDLTMAAAYVLTLKVTDASTGSPIPTCSLVDSNTATYTTNNGVFNLSYPFSSVVVYVSSTGYVSKSASYVIDSNQVQTIQLAAVTATQAPFAVTYPPLNIQFHIQTILGQALPNTFVTATPSQTTLQNYTYLASLFGYALTTTPLNTLQMNGTSDSYGNINFAMMTDTQYAMTFSLPGYTFSNINITPSSSTTNYVITPNNAVNVFQKNGSAPQANVVFSASQYRYNLTTALLTINYTDVSGATTGGSYSLYKTNKTLGNSYSNSTTNTAIISGTFSGNLTSPSYYLIDAATSLCPASNSTIETTNGVKVSCNNGTSIVNDQSYMAAATGNTASGVVNVNGAVIFNNLTSPVGPFGYDILLFFALLFVFITTMAGGAADMPIGSAIAGTFEWFVFEGIGWLHDIDAPIAQLGGIPAPVAVGTVAFFCCCIWAFAEFRRRNK